MKVHMVANFKLKWLASLIGIPFLVGPGSLQVGLDAVDYFLSLTDNVWAKDRPFAKLDPVQRSTASANIQCFEGCHPKTLMIAVVVRELNQQHTLAPFVQII
jgi:hypothetical protein